MKILIVEDDPKHIEDAKRFFASQDVEVVWATTFKEARKYFFSKALEMVMGIKAVSEEDLHIDGVISDIFCPYTNPEDFEWNWKTTTWTEQPVGVGIILLCREQGVPCILNTDGFHHEDRLQWINDLLFMLKLPKMVDSVSVGGPKKWAEAFNKLKKMIQPA